ncbi:hypothetical protein XaC1_542 [Xanthomonas phage XaC1]|nr:hypothetical protein XaC1_542 [Xanthomonas phage XaC1]
MIYIMVGVVLLVIAAYAIALYNQPICATDKFLNSNGIFLVNNIIMYNGDEFWTDNNDLIIKAGKVHYRIRKKHGTYDVLLADHDCIIAEKIRLYQRQKVEIKKLKRLFATKPYYDNLVSSEKTGCA